MNSPQTESSDAVRWLERSFTQRKRDITHNPYGNALIGIRNDHPEDCPCRKDRWNGSVTAMCVAGDWFEEGYGVKATDPTPRYIA